MSRKRKDRRSVHGIVLLDKPLGLSSNQALQKVKHLFNAAKAGHTGSLDPLATGLLPLCLGEATKVSSYLLDSDKYYETVAQLGARSTTGDAEGDKIDQRPVPDLSDVEIEAVLDRFRGEIDQVPPMYSAIKQEGRRLYELARLGQEVHREPRCVTIFRLELTGREKNRLYLRVGCSKGTYIRSLVEDIGEALGCGAYVDYLRRTGVSPYLEPRMWTIESLEELAEQGFEALDAALIPIDTALAHLPAVHLNDEATQKLSLGQPVEAGPLPDGELFRLYQGEDRFLGLGKPVEDGRIAPKRLILHG
jgi:tRNA pseudouridine55 synthase